MIKFASLGWMLDADSPLNRTPVPATVGREKKFLMPETSWFPVRET